MAKLTNLQREFINQYFICGRNATEAAIQAGYKIKNPESREGRATAAAIGYENLRKPHISEQIEERLKHQAMSANEVIARLADIARGDLTHVLNDNGEPDLEKAKRYGVTHLIKEWETEVTVFTDEKGNERVTTKRKVKIHDAPSALVQLGRYHKLFTDRVEITDWETEAVMAIRAGDVQYLELAEEFGDDLATQLFRQAGVEVSVVKEVS